jgi:hypothetical protein
MKKIYVFIRSTGTTFIRAYSPEEIFDAVDYYTEQNPSCELTQEWSEMSGELFSYISQLQKILAHDEKCTLHEVKIFLSIEEVRSEIHDLEATIGMFRNNLKDDL